MDPTNAESADPEPAGRVNTPVDVSEDEWAHSKYDDILSDEGEVSSSRCFYNSWLENFDTIVAKTDPNCKHCNARKEAIIKMAPIIDVNLTKILLTWGVHDLDEGFSFTLNVPENVYLEFFWPLSEEGMLYQPLLYYTFSWN
jgi:hypothetical protein